MSPEPPAFHRQEESLKQTGTGVPQGTFFFFFCRLVFTDSLTPTALIINVYLDMLYRYPYPYKLVLFYPVSIAYYIGLMDNEAEEQRE